jgi:hypothetical protein
MFLGKTLPQIPIEIGTARSGCPLPHGGTVSIPFAKILHASQRSFIHNSAFLVFYFLFIITFSSSKLAHAYFTLQTLFVLLAFVCFISLLINAAHHTNKPTLRQKPKLLSS